MTRSQVRQAPDSATMFLPLEEKYHDNDDAEMMNASLTDRFNVSSEDDEPRKDDKDRKVGKSEKKKKPAIAAKAKSSIVPWRMPKLNGKLIVLIIVATFFLSIIWESFFVAPEDRLIQPDSSDRFLLWVQSHPGWGLGAISLVIGGAVVSMVPIGTPLVLGCGYIYRGVYGWKLGLFVATVVSMVGSGLGAVVCFLLGRYLMRDTVRKWVRKYPLFDAIDVGESSSSSENRNKSAFC